MTAMQRISWLCSAVPPLCLTIILKLQLRHKDNTKKRHFFRMKVLIMILHQIRLLLQYSNEMGIVFVLLNH